MLAKLDARAFFRSWVADRHSLLEVLGFFLNGWTLITLLGIVAMTLSVLRARRKYRRLAREEALEDLEDREAEEAQVPGAEPLP